MSRFSFFLGVGIPDPLKHYFTGFGFDLVPGLKLTTGIHWLWYTKYNIVNNQIADQASAVKYGGWYIGLNIDPATSLSKLLSVFKKS